MHIEVFASEFGCLWKQFGEHWDLCVFNIQEITQEFFLCELPEMFSAVIKCIIKEYFGLFGSSHVQLISPSLLKPCVEIVGVKD